MGEVVHTRYPGTRPFQDGDVDRLTFKGREDEVERLLHLVLAERLVVLFSRSGMGKTSVLNAGITGALRERGFFPIPLRLNIPELPLAEAIDAQVHHTASLRKVEFVPGDKTSLWHYFKTAEFWSDDDSLLTPVLVFDQFEEVFSLDYTPEQQDEFFKQLAELVYGHVTEGEGRETAVARTQRSRETAPDVKIILSLREDYLANLEEINADIPSIFRNRFRLRSLTPENARRAIIEPASIEIPGAASRPFSFNQGVVDSMLAFLQKGGTIPEQHLPAVGRILTWGIMGLGIAVFSVLFDPVVGRSSLSETIIFMRQPAILSAAIGFVGLLLAYFLPLRPLATTASVLLFQVFNLVRYWNAVGTTNTIIDGKIIVISLIGAALAGWISWLRTRRLSSPSRERKRTAEIEPFQIQLLCQHIEEKIRGRQSPGRISGDLVVTERDLGGEKGMEDVLIGFYRDQMNRLGVKKWWSAHRLCENGLISQSGKRLSLDGEFISEKYRVGQPLLDEMIHRHLVRAESRSGNRYYELSHDSLVQPILETAHQRLRRTRVFLLLGTCAGILFFIGKGLVEKANVAKQHVAARNTLAQALKTSDSIGIDPGLRGLLGQLDAILLQQDSLLDLASLQSSTSSRETQSSGVQPVNGQRIGTISGQVLNAKTGGPLVGAEVTFGGASTTVSDEKGEFEIQTNADSLYDARVSMPGYRDTSFAGLRPDATRLTVRLQPVVAPAIQPRKGSIVGRIVDADGDPVKRAKISFGNRREAVAGNDGRINIADVPYGDVTLHVSAPGYQEETRRVTLNSSLQDLKDIRIQQTRTRPVLMNPGSVNASYPEEALPLRINGSRVNGKVRVKASINQQGDVFDVEVLTSVHPLLDSAAVQAVRRGKFSGPGIWKTTYPFQHPGRD